MGMASNNNHYEQSALDDLHVSLGLTLNELSIQELRVWLNFERAFIDRFGLSNLIGLLEGINPAHSGVGDRLVHEILKLTAKDSEKSLGSCKGVGSEVDNIDLNVLVKFSLFVHSLHP
jgi:hypothetical protein